MRIVEEIIGSVLVEIVNLERASLNDSDELKQILDTRIGQGYSKIIIDISLCEYIDSTFLGVLVSGLKKAVKQGGDLKLVGFKPAVAAMFQLTRMFRVFESFSELQEAVKSFSREEF